MVKSLILTILGLEKQGFEGWTREWGVLRIANELWKAAEVAERNG